MSYIADFKQVHIMSHFTDFELVKAMSHFADFGQVKIMGHFAVFGRVKIKILTKLTYEKLDAYATLTFCLLVA